MGHQCISVRTHGNSNTHANSYARPNANGNSYANPDTNGYADANRNSYAYVYRHCHTHSNANSDALPRRMETWLPLNDFLSRPQITQIYADQSRKEKSAGNQGRRKSVDKICSL